MATTYNDMVRKIINWSNRDPEVFGASISGDNVEPGEIRSFMQYAADKAYRGLRVPPLEISRRFIIEDGDIASDNQETDGLPVVNMPVPDDLIEVLHIRNVSKGYVFNQKVDLRTFFDKYADKKDSCYWTRIGNVFKLTGFISVGEELEIHYYHRLPALDAKYLVLAATYNIDPNVFIPVGTTYPGAAPLYFDENGVAYDSQSSEEHLTVSYFVGTEADHWLRDENEKIVLFGALAEAFSFLAEDDQSQKYREMYLTEIKELNHEEVMRAAAGGNIRVNYNGFGQI